MIDHQSHWVWKGKSTTKNLIKRWGYKNSVSCQVQDCLSFLPASLPRRFSHCQLKVEIKTYLI